ncbi:MAG: right-handed parallel beta-helix repeat-containing protein [Phycisphaeraceae bacterium]
MSSRTLTIPVSGECSSLAHNLASLVPALLMLAITLQVTAQPIYVANPDSGGGGDDANPGTLDAPVATIEQAWALSRTDEDRGTILLHAGDSWDGSGGVFSNQRHNSVGSFTLASYGDPALGRPLIGGGISATHLQDTTIRGIQFAGGVSLVRNTQRVVIEDSAFGSGVTLESGASYDMHDITLRGNDISGFSVNGIYATGLTGLTIEGNTIWRDDEPTMWGHGLYIQASVGDVRIVGNHIIRPNHIGIRANGGGQIHDNIVLLAPIGIEVGVPRGVEPSLEPITADVRGNIVMHAAEDTGRGSGYTLGDAGHIVFSHNFAAFLERRALDIEDIAWESQRIDILGLSIHEAPGPSDLALNHPAAQWLGPVVSDHPNPLTILDYDREMGGEGTWESFIHAVRAGATGYDAPAIREWIGAHYSLAMLLGDMNGDGFADSADIAPFVLALVDPTLYTASFSIDPQGVGDINADTSFDTRDVSALVVLLVGGGSALPVPEPGSFTLLGLASACLLRRASR